MQFTANSSDLSDFYLSTLTFLSFFRKPYVTISKQLVSLNYRKGETEHATIATFLAVFMFT